MGSHRPPPQNVTFESWIEAQPEDIKTLVTTHTSGLKSALDSERENRKTLEKQLRDLAKKAEAGSEYQKTLTEQADKLQTLERQGSFYDKAHSAGVRNLKLAYLAAEQAELVSDKGDCDFAKLKTQYPELFLVAPPANAGAGTNTQPPTFNMDALIRRAAGRQ